MAEEEVLDITTVLDPLVDALSELVLSSITGTFFLLLLPFLG
jgi:hypothetical protein